MSDTQRNVRPSNVWLLPAAALYLCACYAEIPGSAPVDDSSGSLFPDSGAQGGLGGTIAGGGLGGDPDGGLSEPGDAGGDLDGQIVTSCDGVAIGTVQTRKLYAEAQVVPPATCKSETQMRTCRNTGWSSWSGTFKAESCMQAAVHSCGNVAHGATESRERYASAIVSDYAECEDGAETQTRECDDGTLGPWSGTATAETCQVSFLGHCSVISDVACVASATCTFKLAGSQCLWNTGHTCAENAECTSGVCVSGSCVAAKVPATGACDEAADCATCSGSVAATCSVRNTRNVCSCGVGANCTANNQCLGTCVASKCVAPNTTCDMDDDCAASSKCKMSSSGSGSGSATGTCLLKDDQPCTANAQCQNICHPSESNELFLANQKVCGPKGGGTNGMEAHCDENADCSSPYVCRPWSGQTVSGGTHCQLPATSGDLCDETVDCAQNVLVPATCSSSTNTCVPTLIAGGGSCISSLQCLSGNCDLSMGSPGSCI